MIVLLSFQVEVPNIQKATALRSSCASLLRDSGCHVTNEAQAQMTQTYTVVGVDTAGDQRFKERVEALSPEEAEAKAVGKSKTKLVAETR